MKDLFTLGAVLALLFSNVSLFATHNMAGQIECRQIGSTQVEAVVVTYTFLESRPADRDSLQIEWGDGSVQMLVRTNGPDPNGDGIADGEVVSEIARRNEYRAVHTYAAAGQYTLSLSDPNRNGDIVNVNFPNSEQILFFVETQIEIGEVPADFNSSPTLLESPIDMGIVGQPFVHNPNAFDADGDSLAYELIAPRQGTGEDVLNYRFPDAIEPGPGNQISINAVTGTLVWDAPQAAATYNIAILIKSYRDGRMIDQTIRDMQVIVEEMGLVLPDVEANFVQDQTYEVEAGQWVDMQISARSFNDSDSLWLTFTSGLEEIGVIHEHFITGDLDGGMVNSELRWYVHPSYQREQPYTFVFKVRESTGQHGWATIKVVRYKVVDAVVSTQQTIDERSIRLFPNPVSDLLTVDNLSEYIDLGYELQSPDGRHIAAGRIGSNRSEIPVQGLASGVYLIRFRSGNRVLTKTFVKK